MGPFIYAYIRLQSQGTQSCSGLTIGCGAVDTLLGLPLTQHAIRPPPKPVLIRSTTAGRSLPGSGWLLSGLLLLGLRPPPLRCGGVGVAVVCGQEEGGSQGSSVEGEGLPGPRIYLSSTSCYPAAGALCEGLPT